MYKVNSYLKYIILVLLFIFLILFIQINRYIVIPPSTTMPSVILDKLTFRAYRIYTSKDETGNTTFAGFMEIKMPKR